MNYNNGKNKFYKNISEFIFYISFSNCFLFILNKEKKFLF